MSDRIVVNQRPTRVTIKDEDKSIVVTGGTVGPRGPAGPEGDHGIGVPVGGSPGQILKKADSGDYDTVWADSVLPTNLDAGFF